MLDNAISSNSNALLNVIIAQCNIVLRVVLVATTNMDAQIPCCHKGVR